MTKHRNLASVGVLAVFVFLAMGSDDSSSTSSSQSLSESTSSYRSSTSSSTPSSPAAPVDPDQHALDVKQLAVCKVSVSRVKRAINKHPLWSDDVLAAVLCGRISIGMTEEQALAAWGRPEDVNRSVYASGTHEQWVYGDNYLYFEDGILTSYQN